MLTRRRYPTAGLLLAACALVGCSDRTATPVAAASSTTGTTSVATLDAVPSTASTTTATQPARPAALPALDRATGTRLLVVQGDELELLDVDSGSVTPVATDARLRGYSRINVTAVGRQVVLVGDDSTGAGGGGGDVLATTDGVISPTRVIGTSDPRLLGSRNPARIWLSSVTDAERTTGRPRTELREVDLRGRTTQRVVFDGTFGATPFAGGFLRDLSLERDAGVELVDARGTRRQSWPGTRFMVAWGDRALLGELAPCPDSCVLRVLTAGSTVSERQVDVQDGGVVDWQASGLSPNDRLLFSAVPQADGAAVRIARTDLDTGATSVLEGVRSTRFYGFTPTFSADGRWMFFPDADQEHVTAYNVTENRSYRAPGRFAGISSLLVVA